MDSKRVGETVIVDEGGQFVKTVWYVNMEPIVA